MSEGAVLVLARSKVGLPAVGVSGECYELVDWVLRHTHPPHYSADHYAPNHQVGEDDDYCWGLLVPLSQVRPGYVVQFRDFVLEVDWEWRAGEETGPGPGLTLERPHHSAIVEEVVRDDNGVTGEMVIIEQNVGAHNNGQALPVAIDLAANVGGQALSENRVVRNRIFVVSSERSATITYEGQLLTVTRSVRVSGSTWFYRPVERPHTTSAFDRRPPGAPMPFGAPSRWA